ncbi:hypothetical protein JVU11DRAFT_2253 [Chiua virens]|nr:hypothetical protein JVU11DRAFT_2253 [Chiua virens]
MTLADLYDRADVSRQFPIRAQIAGFQMKGAADAEYIAFHWHMHTNEKLARMGAKPTETEAICALLRGLPQSRLWPTIRKTIEVDTTRHLDDEQFPGWRTFEFLLARARFSMTHSTS